MSLYYYNAASDGDWSNLANWWQDSGFSTPATALPSSSDEVFINGNVTQNTAGGNCVCAAAEFRDSEFGEGLTLQTTGLVNLFGSSTFAGASTDGMSLHDSSQIASTGLVQGDATLRDSSRNLGHITGNAYVWYDGGNWQNPIGGVVDGSVTYEGVLYYTNASGDTNWETLTNWNTAEDGSGDNPTNIPWTDDGNGGAWYADTDLVDASGGNGINISSAIDPNEVVTGTCNIVSTNNFFGSINGGTFSGDNFCNEYGSINGGTFTGDNFNNNDTINGGTFTGDNFNNGIYVFGGTFSGDNFYNQGNIYGGTFTGSGFININLIYGGTFSGDNFYNSDYITGGTFTGSGFGNGNYISDGTFSGDNFINYNEIDGGTFTGINFINSGGFIYSGTFSGDNFNNYYGNIYGGTFISPAVTLSTSGNMTLLAMSGGPTFSYPTPSPSGGGGGIDIARLIGLPPFIKL